MWSIERKPRQLDARPALSERTSPAHVASNLQSVASSRRASNSASPAGLSRISRQTDPSIERLSQFSGRPIVGAKPGLFDAACAL